MFYETIGEQNGFNYNNAKPTIQKAVKHFHMREKFRG